jgi:hypothetical protein
VPAEKGNSYAKGNKGGGRLPEYKPSYAKMAYKIALLGATDQQLAEVFEVSERTVNNWKKVYKEFNAALKKGKLIADANVAEKLYTRAIGYSFKEVSFEKTGTKEEMDKITNESVTVDLYKKKIVIKEVVPDTTAQIFFLKNRAKQNWRDRQDFKIDFDALTDEQLDLLIERITGQSKK